MGAAIDQVPSGSQRDAAHETCRVIVGTDMRGMSDRDVASIAFTLNDLNKMDSVTTVLIQGLINHIALEHIIRGPMAEELFSAPQDQKGPQARDLDR